MDQYYVHGSDGKEFGPTDLAGLQQWVREGRVLPITQIRKNDHAAIAAQFLPELASLFGAADSSSIAIAPPIVTNIELPNEFRSWQFIGLAWTLVKPHWLQLGLMALIPFGIGAVPYLGWCASFIIGGTLLVGYYRAVLGMLAGRPPTVEMLFSGSDRFGQAFLAGLAVSIIVCLGVLCLIVPGVILAIMFSFVTPILAETDLDFSDAMRASAELTKGYRWKILWFILASFVVTILGALACGVGLLIAQPIVMTATALVYRFLQKQKHNQIANA